MKPDAKNNDKASAIRSKHSVTEQRRRSKINERYIRVPQQCLYSKHFDNHDFKS